MKQEILGHVIWNVKGKFLESNKVYKNVPAARGAMTLMYLNEGEYKILPIYANSKDLKSVIRHR